MEPQDSSSPSQSVNAELEWTGERLVTSLSGQIALEHLHRYALACLLAEGKDVLDIASGEGYGSALLARNAASVAGVDLDETAVRHASAKYPKARFFQGSCTAIPLPPASLDFVVSFETIEHVDDHDAFFSEILRVLRPGGLLLISSPDKEEYGRGRQEANPYHVNELTEDAFEQALRRRFKNVRLARQRMVAGSAIFGTEGEYAIRFCSGNFSRVESEKTLPKGLYIMALCSDSPLPPMPAGLFENPGESAVVWNQFETLPGEIARLRERALASEREAEHTGALRKRVFELQLKLEKANRQHSAERLRFFAIADSPIYKLLFECRKYASIYKRPYDAVRRLFTRTRRLEFTPPLPRCFGMRGIGMVEGTYRLRSDEPAPELVVRVGGRNWKCRVEPVEKRKKGKKIEPPKEFRFSCEFVARDGLQLLELMHSRSYVRTKEIIASSLVWGSPPPWAPQAFQMAEKKKLSLPETDSPLVSIIIPVRGNLTLTVRCLGCILTNTTDVEYEVIIGDDRSEEAFSNLLGSIPGVRVSKNTGDSGFLPNCNQAAAKARGKYLLFLNNDTEVRPGWLSALVDVFDKFPDAGAAGSKLLNAGGTLQEAGGIIWKDGSGWNYGRDDDPGKPEYNYVKETDYVSGASLLVERKLFEELGAFSPEFSPGYYEDADLAFKIRAAGRKVYYQPRSVVVHLEGKTSGTDLASGMKRWQVINRSKFEEKWGAELSAGHYPNGVNVLRARERSRGKKLAVFIDHHVPFIDQDAGSRSTFQYIKLFLDAGVSVKFVGDNFATHEPYTGMLQQIGVEVLDGKWFACNIHDWFVRNADEIDVVFANRSHITVKYLKSFGFLKKARILYYGIDIASVRLQRLFELTNSPAAQLEAEAEAESEMAIWRSVDAVYYPSVEEIKHVHSKLPGANARAIPLNIFEPLAEDYAGTLGVRKDLLFVGGFQHHPNIDGVLFFLEHCWPLIEAALPDCKIHIVGSKPPESIVRRASERIRIAGWVSDEELDAYYRRVRLVVVPLRYGGGVKGKVVEAARHNVPQVLTPMAAEGLAGIEACGVILCINTEPERFASEVIRLYRDDAASRAYSNCCADFIRANFSPAAAREILARDIPWLKAHSAASPAAASAHAAKPG